MVRFQNTTGRPSVEGVKIRQGEVRMTRLDEVRVETPWVFHVVNCCRDQQAKALKAPGVATRSRAITLTFCLSVVFMQSQGTV